MGKPREAEAEGEAASLFALELSPAGVELGLNWG